MQRLGSLIGLLVVGVMLAGCGDAEQATVDGSDESRAARTLEEMLEVAERGDWGAYVDRFYGERQKLGSPSDRAQLVQRFEAQWGAKVLPVLQRAVQLTPRIDGDKALFEDAGTPVFVLHRTEDGGWSFHL